MSNKRKYVPSEGPYQCYLKCGAMLSSIFDMEASKDWEWFAGYGESAIHFCPKCRKTSPEQIAMHRRNLSVKPLGYPAVRAKP